MAKLRILARFMVVFLLLIFGMAIWTSQEAFYRFYFDKVNDQEVVESKKQIDVILQSFEKVSYSQLDEEYKKYTKSATSKYSKLIKDKVYYKITRNDFYKYIVGNIRINELLSKDKYYRQCLYNKEKEYYWLVDKKLLYKLLALQKELKKEGYNQNGFTISSCHRHPQHNEKVGGAKMSRHIKGEAIDLRINDIDGNGRYEKKDKEIVLALLEKKIIKSEGGIGRYPNSRAIHFDVRGYRARWDKQ